MAVREYIGARYVPKFMGTYDVTQVYEALDVVDNGLGTSYISKIPTPAGTPLTDTDHWAVYGVASGAILNLENRMTSAENDIGALDTRLDNDEGDISNLQTGLATANANIKKRRRRNIICIGDSYGTYSVGNTSWIEYLKNRNLGDFYDNNKGGSGFLAAYYDPGEGTYKSFETLLRELENTVTDPDSITDVIVCGGYNDYSAGHPYISDLGTAMAAFASYARSQYPNAVLWVGMIGRSTDLDRLDITSGLLTETYPYYLNNARNTGMTYLTGVECVLKRDDDMRSDHHHPNNSGSVKLGYAILNSIQGSGPAQFYNSGSALTPGSGYSFSGTPTIGYSADMYGMNVNISEIKIIPDSAPVSITYNNTVFDVATIDIPYGQPFVDVKTSVRVLITDAAYHFVTAVGFLYIHNNTIKLNVTSIERESGSWDAINTRQITMCASSVYIPAHCY